MERSFYGSALVLGLIVWLCCLVLTRGEDRKHFPMFVSGISNSFLFAAIFVPLLGFLATLPSQPPFASGQGLGKGLLLGALGAWLTAWTVGRSLATEDVTMSSSHSIQLPTDEPPTTEHLQAHSNKESAEKLNEPSNEMLKARPQSRSAFVAPLALGVVVACIPLLWLRDIVVDALLGTAIGWLTVSLLLLAGLNAAGISARITSLALLAGTGFTATVCSIAALGELGGNARFGDGLAALAWSAPLIALSASVPFLLLLCSLINFRPLHSWPSVFNKTSCRWLLAGGLLLFVGRQFASKLDIYAPPLFRLLGMGLLASALVWWLLAASLRAARENGREGRAVPWQSFALPVLLIMAASMVAFQMFAGVGVGVFLLGAWLTLGIALLGVAEEVSDANGAEQEITGESISLVSVSHLIRLLFFGTLLLLYRLFQVRFTEDLHNISLSDHYAFLGFIVGAALPAAMVGCVRLSARHRVSSGNNSFGSKSSRSDFIGSKEIVNKEAGEACASLLLVLVMGIVTLFVPALLLLLFGTKCLLCLFFGLALAAVLSDSASHAIPTIPADEKVSGVVSSQGKELHSFNPVSSELLTALFALAMALALTQWTHLLMPITLMSRADKIHLLTAVAGCAIALLVISEIGLRLRRSVTTGGPR